MTVHRVGVFPPYLINRTSSFELRLEAKANDNGDSFGMFSFFDEFLFQICPWKSQEKEYTHLELIFGDLLAIVRDVSDLLRRHDLGHQHISFVMSV